jgi:PAS domain S-box-containing protein
MAEAAPFGMMVLSDMADVVYANPQHRTVLGYGVEECGGLALWLKRGFGSEGEPQERAMDDWWERVWRRRLPWTCSMRNAEGWMKEVEFRPSVLAGHRLLLTVFDVTDSRLEEQTLKASEGRYRGLFQNCGVAVAVLNAGGNVAEVNARFEELTGYPRLEIRRAGLAKVLPEAEAERVVRAMAGGGSGEVLGGVVTEMTGRDGTRTLVSMSVSVTRGEEGEAVHAALFLVPVVGGGTAGAGAAGGAGAVRPLTWVEGRMAQTVADLVMVLDGAGRILEYSGGRDFAGLLPAGEMMRERVLDAVLPAIAEQLPMDVMMARLRENPEAETRCEFVYQPDVREKGRVLEARMVLLSVEGAGEYGVVLRDVSAVAAGVRDEGGAMAWFEGLESAVVVMNDRGRISGLNGAAERMFGYGLEELEGEGLYRLFRPDDARSFSEEISEQLNREGRWKAVSGFRRRDRSTGTAEVELVPVTDEGSGSRKFLALIRERAVAGRATVTLHRARNDLQLLSSLLALQADDAPAGEVRDAVTAGRDRLAAVALIYRMIGGEDDRVDFARYATELAGALRESRGVAGGVPRVEMAVEAVVLPQKLAITLGVILGELLSVAMAQRVAQPDPVVRVGLVAGAGEVRLRFRTVPVAARAD